MEGRERKGVEGDTRHTNPSLLPAPLASSAVTDESKSKLHYPQV